MDPLGKQSNLITQMLDLAARRQEIIGGNIANVGTPGYKARTLEFDDVLGKVTLKEREGVEARQDGNTVVMELELADMRKNELVYRVFIQAMLQKARQMRSAISGRSG